MIGQSRGCLSSIEGPSTGSDVWIYFQMHINSSAASDWCQWVLWRWVLRRESWFVAPVFRHISWNGFRSSSPRPSTQETEIVSLRNRPPQPGHNLLHAADSEPASECAWPSLCPLLHIWPGPKHLYEPTRLFSEINTSTGHFCHVHVNTWVIVVFLREDIYYSILFAQIVFIRKWDMYDGKGDL